MFDKFILEVTLNQKTKVSYTIKLLMLEFSTNERTDKDGTDFITKTSSPEAF